MVSTLAKPPQQVLQPIKKEEEPSIPEAAVPAFADAALYQRIYLQTQDTESTLKKVKVDWISPMSWSRQQQIEDQLPAILKVQLYNMTYLQRKCGPKEYKYGQSFQTSLMFREDAAPAATQASSKYEYTITLRESDTGFWDNQSKLEAMGLMGLVGYVF
jgi:hypothetical protein